MLQKSCPKVRVAWAIFIIISPAKKLPSQCSHFTIVVLTQENGWEKKEVIKTVLSICTKCTISWRILRSHYSKSSLFGPKSQLLGKNYRVVDLNFWTQFDRKSWTKIAKKVNFQPQNWSKLTFSTFSKNPIRVKI